MSEKEMSSPETLVETQPIEVETVQAEALVQSAGINHESTSEASSTVEGTSDSSESKETAKPPKANAEKKEKVQKKPSERAAAFLKEMKTKEKLEDKIAAALTFMKESLSHPQHPQFRDFWSVRREVLPLFRQMTDGGTKKEMWEMLNTLTLECKGLKSILDEQASFAVEQIGLAIDAIEADIQNLSVGDTALTWKPKHFPQALKSKAKEYTQWQNELNKLNTIAGRLNALRKELIKTEMRIRIKNKIFERLSKAGDLVFPSRKELIKKVSVAFTADVQKFEETNFSKKELSRPPFHFRNEIKNFQILAKELSLNTQAFNKTRESLSRCWEVLKPFEAEFKAKRNQDRQQAQEKLEQFVTQLDEIKNLLEGKQLSESQLFTRLEEISKKARAMRLGKEANLALKAKIDEIKAPFIEKQLENERLRKEKNEQKKQQRAAKISALETQIKTFLESASELDVQEVKKKVSEFQSELTALQQNLNLQRIEREGCEKFLRELKRSLQNRRHEKLMNMSDSEKKNYEAQVTFIDDLMAHRNEIKSQLETHKKSLGNSGLDFERALALNELIGEDKQNLKKIDQMIAQAQKELEALEK